MRKILAGALPLLSFVSFAYAQSATPEPPAETASPLTIAVFLIVFIGGCVAYVAFTWWRGGKEEAAQPDEPIEEGRMRSRG